MVLTTLSAKPFFEEIVYGEVNLVTIMFTSQIPMKVLFQLIIFPYMQKEVTDRFDIVGAMLVTLGLEGLPGYQLIRYHLEKTSKTGNNENIQLLKTKLTSTNDSQNDITNDYQRLESNE